MFFDKTNYYGNAMEIACKKVMKKVTGSNSTLI